MIDLQIVALVINDAKTTGKNKIDFKDGNFPGIEDNAGNNEFDIKYKAIPDQVIKVDEEANAIFDWDAVEED